MPSDVLITPASSKIDFTDGNNSTKRLNISGTAFNFNSNLNVLSSTSLSSAFKAEGVNGTLFEVIDDLSNSLMSVNTIGGLPVFEVFANNSIIAGQYNANDFVILGNKIGLGYANPVNKLSVSGAVSIGASYNVAAPSNGLIVQGDVGIGVTSFAFSSANRANLEMYGSSESLLALRNSTGNSYIQKSGADFYINNVTNGFIAISNNGSERWRITNAGVFESNNAQTIRTSTGNLTLATFAGDGHILLSPHNNGNVGIRTTSPGYGLHVVGASVNPAGIVSNRFIGLRKTDTTLPGYLALLGGDNGDNAKIIGYNSSGAQTFQIDASSVVTYFNGGNVGIGTTSPSAKLQINNASDSRLIVYETGTAPYTATLELSSQVLGTYGGTVQYTSNAETLTIENYGRTATNSVQGSILFKTKINNTTATNVAIINGFTGNVGIATLSPSEKLEVVGVIKGTSFSGAGTGLTGVASSLTAGTVTTNANLTGPITSIGNATTITNSAVTYAKIQNVNLNTVLGRITNTAGVVEELNGANIATIIGSNAVANAVTAGTANALNTANSYEAVSLNLTGTLQFGGSINWNHGVTTELGRKTIGYNIWQGGKKLNADEDFNSGNNGITVYNNSGGTALTITRTSLATAPNSSGQVLRVSYNPGSNGTSPGFGGFFFGTLTSANKVFVTRFIANIPAGRSLSFHSNAFGSNNNSYWLTNNIGTGKWEEYVFVVMCGNTGTFSSTNFFAISGGSDVAFTWDIASATVFDVTNKRDLVSSNFESYQSSNALTFNYLATNLNGNNPVPIYAFDVTSGAETRSIKAGLGYERHLTNGRGTLHIYNRSSDDAINITGLRSSAGDIKVSIDNAGNVGIGTTIPASILHLNGTAPTILTLSSTSYTSTYLSTFGVDSGARAFLIFGNNAENQVRAGRTSTGGYLDFYTNNTVGQTTAVSDGNFVMRLTAGGNIGVGATTASNKLTVSGPVSIGSGYNTAAPTNGLIVEGSVGIGITNPADKLHVIGNIRINGGDILNWSGQAFIQTIGANDMFFRPNSALQMILTAGGNLGVGNGFVNPLAKLHLNSTTSGATLLRADGTNGTLFSVIDDLSDSLMSVNNSAGLPVLEVFADDRVVAGQYGANDFVLINNKLGLGTNSPAYKLDVRGSTVNARVGLMEFGAWPLDTTYIYLQNNSLSLIGANYGFLQGPTGETFVNAASGQTLHFRTGNTERWAITSGGILQSDGAQTIRTSTNALTLATNGGNGHIILSPNGTGNVGIGTISPIAKLETYGGSMDPTLTPGDPSIFSVNSLGVQLAVGRMVTTPFSIWFQGKHATVGGGLTYPIVLNPLGGNVGIGTTSPGARLDVRPTTATAYQGTVPYQTTTAAILSPVMAAASVDTYTSILQLVSVRQALVAGRYAHGYLGFSTVDNSNINGILDAGRISIKNDDGIGSFSATSMGFWTNTGGSASNPATERVRIASDGNVGIGTTTPAALLQIGAGTPTSVTGGIQFGDDVSARLYRTAPGVITCPGTIAATFSGSLTGTASGNLTSSSTLTAGNLSGTIPSAVLGNSSVFIGTTSIALNRGSAALTLSGVNISGTAASETFATVTGRGSSTTTQISVGTTSSGSMYTGIKSGAGYSDTVSGATFKSITDHPTGGSFAFAAYYNGAPGTGTNSFYVAANGGAYFAQGVGIGVTPPLQALHVNGNIILDGVTNGYTQGATRGIGYGSNNGGVSVNGFSGMDIQSVNAPAPNNGNYSQNLRFWTHHYGTGSGGTPRMFIQYDGNVGIGSLAPSAKLNVLSSTSLSSVFKTEGVNGTLFEVTDDLSNSLMSVNTIGGLPVFEVFANNSIIAGQYGQNDFVISGNKIGIGTASPLTKLHIYENVSRVTYIAQNSLHTARFEAFGTATAIDTTASNGIFFRINSSSIVKFAADGNVGIGTVTPANKLHVLTTGGVVNAPNVVAIFQANTATTTIAGGGTAIKFVGVSSGGNLQDYDQCMISSLGYADNNRHGIQFWVKPNASTVLTAALTINSDSSVVANSSITAASFSGPLTGNVTGNVSGSSGSCTGNAATATKLFAAVNINGTSFDGSAAITTANWGTARTLTIGSTGKSVNGSGNVAWTLAEIGAVPSAGGTMAGTLTTYTPGVQTSLSGLSAFNAGVNVGEASIAAGVASFVPGFGQTTLITATGYRSHMILGSYRTAGANWNGGPFIAWGGNDAYPTEYWLFNQGGAITHSSGITFLNTNSTLTAGNLSGTIPSAVLGNSSVFIGTTSVALNRASAALTLNGVDVSGTASNVTGIVLPANGGTGVSTANVNTFFAGPSTGSAAAPSFRTITTADIPSNIGLTNPTINNIRMGYTSTATAGGTTTLTVNSNIYQRFTGTTTQTIVLPVTSTLVAGMSYTIENISTGNLTVNSSGGNPVITVIPGVTVTCLCVGTGSTTAADWDAEYDEFASITGTGSVVLSTSPTLVTPALGTPASGNLLNCTFPTLNQNTIGTASNVTGTVLIANGGTGATTAAQARTNLEATTVGSNFFTLANPGAERYVRINAANTISLLSATDFKTALGIGTTGGSGTVTTVSVVSANGFAGTVANATTTPAITLSTSITGVLKGNGTAISAATSGTDYLAPNTNITVNQLTATQAIIQKKVQPASNITGSSAVPIDVSSANVHVLTLDNGAVITGFTYNNRAADAAVNTILLVIKYLGTSASITWTNVIWANGNDPTLTKVNGYADVYALTSYKGASGYWIGTVVAQNLLSTNL